MFIVQICVGSACHIKGSQQVVESFQSAIEEHGMQEEVVLTGSFCTGKCNREGVTVTINDVIHTGITKDNFDDFFKENILDVAKKGE